MQRTAKELAQLIDEERPGLEKALKYDHGGASFDEVKEAILAEDMQLWVNPERTYVMVTEIVNYPGKRVVNVFLTSGSIDDIKAVFPQLQEMARAVGAQGIECSGRRGWIRALSGLGFREVSTIAYVEV